MRLSSSSTDRWQGPISGPQCMSFQPLSAPFTNYGKQFATTNKGQVRVWDVATGRLLSGRSGTPENFVRIGHSLLSLIAAFLGGQLSRQLYASDRESATM